MQCVTQRESVVGIAVLKFDDLRRRGYRVTPRTTEAHCVNDLDLGLFSAELYTAVATVVCRPRFCHLKVCGVQTCIVLMLTVRVLWLRMGGKGLG